jgi:hypothetical protein
MENSIPKNLESVGVNFQIWCFKNNKYLNYILGEFWSFCDITSVIEWLIKTRTKVHSFCITLFETNEKDNFENNQI